MSPRARCALASVAALAATWACAPFSSAQSPAPPTGEVGVEGGTLTLNTRFQVKMDFGVRASPPPPAGSGQEFWYFSDKSVELATRMLVGPGCFADQSSRLFVFCLAEPIKRFVIKLAPPDDTLKIRAEVPRVPGNGRVDAGAGDDRVDGGKNDERINAGKGDDKVDPGKGKDVVNAGPGNDRVDSRDGERDTVNGGKGKHDVAKADKKDKVKNVEVVKRR